MLDLFSENEKKVINPNFRINHFLFIKFSEAEDGIRTRDPHHGKVMFYH